MSEHIDRICDRIAHAIGDEDDVEDTLRALAAIYSFEVSLLDCAHCRKQAMHSLKQCIPEMLANANRAAARRMSKDAQQPTPSVRHLH